MRAVTFIVRSGRQNLLAFPARAPREKTVHIRTRAVNIWDIYYKNLNIWAKDNGVQLPTVPDHCEQDCVSKELYARAIDPLYLGVLLLIVRAFCVGQTRRLDPRLN